MGYLGPAFVLESVNLYIRFYISSPVAFVRSIRDDEVLIQQSLLVL